MKMNISQLFRKILLKTKTADKVILQTSWLLNWKKKPRFELVYFIFIQLW